MVPKLLEILEPPVSGNSKSVMIQVTEQPTTAEEAEDAEDLDLSPKSIVTQAVARRGWEAAVHALLGKEGDVAQYADAAFDRVPDQVNLDIFIAAPRVQIPVKDLSDVPNSQRSDTAARRMEVALVDTMLMVATKRVSWSQFETVPLAMNFTWKPKQHAMGFMMADAFFQEEFNVISPLPIDIKLNHNETDDALAETRFPQVRWTSPRLRQKFREPEHARAIRTHETADVSVNIGDLTLIAAPQAVRVLAKLPDVFAELAPETETETTETKEAGAEMILLRLVRWISPFLPFLLL
eukprot:Skav227618  [mRNA]  locus=scaffold1141:649989:652677:- [translate_table: standard]